MIEQPKRQFFDYLIVIVFLCAAIAFSGGCTDIKTPAPNINPVNAKIQPWKFSNVNGLKITTDRYQLFTTVNREFALRMAGFLELCADNYDSLTGLDSKTNKSGKSEYMKVYIFANREQWAALTEVITGSAGSTALKIGVGGYCYKGVCIFWDIGPEATSRVAAHEGLHQYLYHRLYQRLPAWADEGLAVLAEGFELDRFGQPTFDYSKNHGRKATLRKLIYSHREQTAEKLCSMSSSDNLEENQLFAADYYAQIWAFMNMIKSEAQTNTGFKQMCQDAASGKLRSELGISRSQWRKINFDYNQYSHQIGPAVLEKYILGPQDLNPEKMEQNFAQFSRELADITN